MPEVNISFFLEDDFPLQGYVPYKKPVIFLSANIRIDIYDTVIISERCVCKNGQENTVPQDSRTFSGRSA